MKSYLLMAATLFAVSIACCGEIPLKGDIDAVTVYRGQALVTRVVELKLPAGLQEIVVTDLPARVVPGSIYAEADEGVEVRSVQYRERPVDTDIREEVRKFDAEIRQTQDKLQANARSREVLNDRKSYLSKLEQFTAPTATFELTKGVLNAETLKNITNYQFEQRQSIATEELKLSLEERDLNELLSVQQRQRQEVTGTSAKTAREALVFVNLTNAAGGKIRLRYLVDQASWSPSYNIRADAKREKVLVEYNASIQQLSGEDWPSVQMTLSTATPSLVARAPSLAPLTVTLAPIGRTSVVVQADEYGVQRELIVQRRNRAEQGRGQNAYNNGGTNDSNSNNIQANPSATTQQQFAGNSTNVANMLSNSNRDAVEQADQDLNGIAGELQILDLVASGKIAKKPGKEHVADESVSITYELAGRTTMPSREGEQLIQIASLPMKGEFYKVAIPLLTNYVYEEASLTNEGKFVLLSGPSSTYIGQQFMGRGDVPTVAIGESFTTGFGIDASLRTQRELVEKTEAIQGGNRVLSFTYRVQVENFGTEAAAVRILDRLPTAKENEIRVTQPEIAAGQEISKDPMYEKNDHKKGILRWDASVPVQSIGPKAFSVQYKFQMEYEKQMGVTGMPANSAK